MSKEVTHMNLPIESKETESDFIKVVRLSKNKSEMESLAKRIHDLNSAIRVVKFLTESLQAGYRFDDEWAEKKIESVEKAQVTLEREVRFLNDLLKT